MRWCWSWALAQWVAIEITVPAISVRALNIPNLLLRRAAIEKRFNEPN
jgi:hypothetical protein